MCFTDHLVPVYDFQIIELVNVSLQKGSVSKLEQLSIIDGIQTSNSVNTHTSDTSFRQINIGSRRAQFQPAFTCSNSTMETLRHFLKSIQS